MREILFRGKRIDNGEWVLSGNIISFIPENGEDLIFIPALSEPCICDHDENDNIIAFEKGMFYKVDTKTVGQYTGLKDKNGKRIFDGDIVQYQFDNDYCPFPNKRIDKIIGRIFFSEFRASFSVTAGINGSDMLNDDLFKYVQNGNRVEIIGNIHDNKLEDFDNGR